MSPRTTHPLVDAYLRDLELLLHGIEPGERAEVLAGVREHLDGSLAPGADDASVRAVLAELGPPQAIADEAYAGRPGPLPAAPQPPGPPARWQAVVATAINALGLVFTALLMTLSIHPAELLVVGWFYALPWLAGLILAVLSPLWSAREKATSALLFPTTLLGLVVAVGVLYAWAGPSLVNLAPAVAILGAAVWVLVRLLRSALR